MDELEKLKAENKELKKTVSDYEDIVSDLKKEIEDYKDTIARVKDLAGDINRLL